MTTQRVLLVNLGLLAALGLGGCGRSPADLPEAAGKIPVTTFSQEARTAFQQGRELVENLRLTDARQHYQRAVEIDPGFAWAHLGLATTATTNSQFFDALGRAVELAPQASDGERLLIQGFAAGVNGEPDRQLELLQALVEAYPDDERAQTQIGNYYFLRQEWQPAADYLRRATEINPGFAPAYNQLGYALRFQGDFEGAEKVFARYTELIPDEPNPYDSYAELLLRMGRFEESIAQYRKALAIDPNFVPSYVGIGNDLMLMGDFDGARESFEKVESVARTDGERRQACTWLALAALHQEDHETAAAEARRCYAVAEASGDQGAMSADMNLLADVLMAAGRHAEARQAYEESLRLAEASNATDQAKAAARRNHVADLCRLALAEGEVETAAARAEEYRTAVAEHGIRFEILQGHELTGLVALERGDAGSALGELQQANPNDGRVMLAVAKAYGALGDEKSAQEMLERLVSFNTLNQAPQSYALARPAALAMLAR